MKSMVALPQKAVTACGKNVVVKLFRLFVISATRKQGVTLDLQEPVDLKCGFFDMSFGASSSWPFFKVFSHSQPNHLYSSFRPSCLIPNREVRNSGLLLRSRFLVDDLVRNLCSSK